MSAKSVVLEVVSVLAIAGSIAAIAVPKASEIQSGRTANSVTSDIETVRTAVYAFYSDSAYFPPEAPQGDIPVSLEQYLPPSFSFRRSYGVLEYKNWPGRVKSIARDAPAAAESLAPDTIAADTGSITSVDTIAGSLVLPRSGLIRTPPAPVAEPTSADSADAGRIIGVTVTTRDPRVGAIAAQRARRTARFIVGDKVTFLLFGA